MMNEKQISTTTIKHIIVTSNRLCEQVISSIEELMDGSAVNLDEFIKRLSTSKVPWQEASQMIEKQLGKSSFHIFNKTDHGFLLSLTGKPRRAVQYTIGNPLLAVQMTQPIPAVALYAPLKLAIYEDDMARTVITYDLLSSQLWQFHNAEVTRMAEHIDSLLEKLIHSVV